jgi:L-2-hydroxyglutarate oxidase LhgO
MDNVSFHLNCEITEIEKIKNNVSVIRTGYGGSKSKEFKCDAVVFCNGW